MHGRIVRLDETGATVGTVGGKGASLARLIAAGVPVPPGFCVTTTAYREFVAGGLEQHIRDALTGSPAEAAASISAAFRGRELPTPIAAAVRAALPDRPVVVRSSATHEDSAAASFAGQHDTYLNVRGADAVLAAIRDCWASLWTERAIAYREFSGVGHAGATIAVVVQEFVPAEAAGVLFTANPVTGARDEVVINATWGLGDALVSGHVTPDRYVVERGGTLRSRQVGDKTVRTVPSVEGSVREQPVPSADRRRPVLDRARAEELARLGERVEGLYGVPVDVEWTAFAGRFVIVQARPITTPEVWNDSCKGDYLWTSVNVGEAVPSVMTPATWSLISSLAAPPIGPHPVAGNIAGRFYLNLSATTAMADALGVGRAVRRSHELTFGFLPEGIEVPPLPMSRWQVLRASVRTVVPLLRDMITLRHRLPRLAAANLARCRELRARIAQAATPADLHAMWVAEVAPLLHDVSPVLDAGARRQTSGSLEPALARLVGEQDARTLLSGLHGSGTELASLGPLLGLARLRSGTLDRESFIEQWGHRGPDEFEMSAPRPAEDPAWLDQQIERLANPTSLLARQAAARDEAWNRLVAAHPGASRRWGRRIAAAAAKGRDRERARSEFVRTFWVFRAFFQRAGDLTGHGDDMFFVTIDEAAAVLTGSLTPLATVPSRRAAYERYRTLPTPPTFIRGRFDPEAWSADPKRRADVYDETAKARPTGETVAGIPGAAGLVAGTARVVATVADAQRLEPGEILVTHVTNIGWTPLFPRAAAVITDVGAQLSHAAIVARELGVPAVVGCGNATSRISTGDRLLVDGAAGTVTILSSRG